MSCIFCPDVRSEDELSEYKDNSVLMIQTSQNAKDPILWHIYDKDPQLHLWFTLTSTATQPITEHFPYDGKCHLGKEIEDD